MDTDDVIRLLGLIACQLPVALTFRWLGRLEERERMRKLECERIRGMVGTLKAVVAGSEARLTREGVTA
jgi:hypothetical protein